MSTQLEGTIQFGADKASAVDVSAEVFKLAVVEERNTNTRRPTFANANESLTAGAYKAMFEVDFEELLDPTASLAHAEVTTAIRSDAAEMYISGALVPDSVATAGTPENPIYEGVVVVDSVSTGGEVGAELEQSHTWTVNSDGLTIDVTSGV